MPSPFRTMKIKQKPKIIGLGRIVDTSKDGRTYIVRLYNETGLPKGEIITGVKFASERANAELTAWAKSKIKLLSDDELDTIARQNILYNSYMEVEIV